MREFILSLLQGLSPELATTLLAAIPMTEMRASIPVAITVFHLSVARAVSFSVLGNLLPIPVLFWLLPPCIAFVERHIPPLNRLMQRYFAYLRRKHDRVQTVGGIALAAVTLLPLPGAGVWTGCVIAVLFRLSPRVSVGALVVGVLIEAVIVTLITTGTLGALSWIL